MPQTFKPCTKVWGFNLYKYDKIISVVGESCGRLRLPAAESSIHTPRISAVTASDRVTYEDTSKKEATWCKVLGHYDAEYDSALRVFEGWWHRRHFVRIVRNRNGNLNVPYLYENGDKVVLNWNWTDNDWNDNNPALRLATHFLSLLATDYF